MLINTLNAKTLAAMIDHTLLKPDADEAGLRALCAEAVQFGFGAVCVNPANIAFCKHELAGTPVRLCTVIGFPLGASTSAVKVFEARDAVVRGADEIDMVINIGALKSGAVGVVRDEIRAVREICAGKVLKVILETCLLTDDEKRSVCGLAEAAGADFVKTSTGFGPAGATPADVRLLRASVGAAVGVKASGGIRTLESALAMIEAGAARLGTSASAAIVQAFEQKGERNTP